MAERKESSVNCKMTQRAMRRAVRRHPDFMKYEKKRGGVQAVGAAGLGDGEGQGVQEGLKEVHLLMASWREDDKVRNVHLGSSRKIKAEALRLRNSE